MDNFIDEIDEELKRERQLDLWRKYGRYAIAGVLVVIIAVAGFVGWRHYQANRRAEAGLAYAEALDAAAAGHSQEALKSLKALGQSAPSGYAELARLQEATVLAREGNEAAAAAIFDAMAKDENVAKPFRHLALLLYGFAAIDHADPQALAARIKPLTLATSPWRYSALELTALIARKRGDEKTARSIFKRLSDDATTPPSVRARAAEFLALDQK